MKKKYLLLLIALIVNATFSYSQTLTQKMYFDFGPNDVTNGNITIGPDLNGNYWNNPTVPKVATATPLQLVNAKNAATGYVFELVRNFSTNGIKHGGLLNPAVELLHDFAIATATQDYFFVEGGDGVTGAFKLTKLDKNKAYKFYMFGSRTDANPRIATYTFSGLNTISGNLQTTGLNLGGAGYNANTSSIFVSDLVYPDASGEINVQVIRQTGSFAHLNVMKVEEYSASIIEATSITIAGDNITSSGSISQMSVQVAPANAFVPAVIWSVDDREIASINESGVVFPKKNGTINVTATIKYDGFEIAATKKIIVENQLANLYFSGSGTENGDNIPTAIPMKMVTGLDSSVSNVFEIYTSLKAGGSFNFYTSQDILTAQIYGDNGTSGTIVQGGSPINATASGPVLITVDLNTNTVEITPITDMSLVGSATPNGWNVSTGISLPYLGDGVWSAKVTLLAGTGNDPARFVFAVNKSWGSSLKKVTNTENQIAMESQANKNGYTVEDIGSNLRGGTYILTLDLKNYTYSILCESINDYKISMMGSSVANGQGATSMQGYSYMLDQLLQKRHTANEGLDWGILGISVNGNNTLKLLDRWNKDLIGDCSGYVVYGLSLGNEGIHENGQPSFDQFKENMLLLIDKARQANKFPIVTNSYTRGDFNSTDYEYVKKMNLLIHEWDVPSVNLLGAIDDGAGKWAAGYQVEGDIYHPTTAGHAEFLYAFVPSLFDAVEAGKPLPTRQIGNSYTFDYNKEVAHLEFVPEEIIHSFTVSFDVKTAHLGVLSSFTEKTSSGIGYLKINESGFIVYQSPIGGTIESSSRANDDQWHKVSLTHYYAQGRTILYIDNVKVGELKEKLLANTFKLNDASNAVSIINYRDLLFYRSAMNIEEIVALNDGKMLKSSLEIYAPLEGGNSLLTNLAQSMNNTLKLVVDKTSGIEDNLNELGSVTIYPNPTVDYLIVNGLDKDKEYNLKIFTTSGRLMKILSSLKDQDRIDVSDLSSSVYIMEIVETRSSESMISRFVIK